MGDDENDFVSVGQGIKSGPNRIRRNMNFIGVGNYEVMDGDTIKLKIPNFQGRNYLDAYL